MALQGGHVCNLGYLGGLLGVARSLGDLEIKAELAASADTPCPLSSEPEISEHELCQEDEFLIVASDGELHDTHTLLVSVVRRGLARRPLFAAFPLCTYICMMPDAKGSALGPCSWSMQLYYTPVVGKKTLSDCREMFRCVHLRALLILCQYSCVYYRPAGLWDVLPNQRAVEIGRQKLRQVNDPTACAQELLQQAQAMHGTDNMTAVVVCFGCDPPPRRTYGSSVKLAATDSSAQG